MTSFWANKTVVVAGGFGFLGSYVVSALSSKQPLAVVVPRSSEYDLRNGDAVRRLLSDVLGQVRSPSDVIVIHAAGVVGGIAANLQEPGRFFYENLMMGTQLLHECWSHGVGKFVGIGTVCSYPKDASIPFREADLWLGYPEPTNAPYGLAKKMLLVQSQAYRAQYGYSAIYLLPTNLYGPRDNFNLETSHVIPALIRKCVEAREARAPKVVGWGTGNATRDYLYAEDCANGILLAAEVYDEAEPLNLGSNGGEIGMRELLAMVCALTRFEGGIEWDTTKPDGQPRRKIDNSRARREIGFDPATPLEVGLRRTVEWFEEHRSEIRA